MTTPTVPTPSLRASGALAGAAAGLLVAISAFVPSGAVAGIFVVLAGALAWGWPRLVNLPSPRGTTVVLAGTSVALVSVMLLTPADHRTRWAGAIVSVGLIASFLHQLLRQDGRPRLVISVAGTALGLGILGAGSYLLADHTFADSHDLLVAAGAAVSLGAIIDGVVGKTQRRIELGIGQTILGALIGAATVAFTSASPAAAAATGALSGLISWATLRTVVTVATSAHRRAQVSAGASMALISGFVPFAVAHLLNR